MKKFSFSDQDPEKRLEVLESFIEYWMGPRSPEFGATEKQLEHLKIPAPLHRLYEFCFNWPGENSQRWGIPLLSRQNVLKRIQTKDKSYHEVPQGLVLFASENQGVTSWATLDVGEDPAVYGLDYEWGTFYTSPDGKEHRRWTEISSSLTDFLIGFALHELCIAKWINIPTSFITHIQNQPEKIAPLVDNVHGHPVALYLYEEDVLVFRWDWEEPETTIIAARNDATIVKLQQFAGSILGVSLIAIMVSEDAEIKWQFGFGTDGSGSIISSGNRKFLSRDAIPVGSINFDEVVKVVESHLSFDKSADCHTETKVNRVVVDYMKRISTSARSYLPSTVVQGLFQQAIAAIENPSPQLQEQLKIGSPLDM